VSRPEHRSPTRTSYRRVPVGLRSQMRVGAWDRASLAFGPGTVHRVSQQALVFEHVLRFPVEPVCIGVNDRRVLGFLFCPFQSGEVGTRSPLDERRTIGVRPVNPFEQIVRKCDRCLHSHKMIILPARLTLRVSGLHLATQTPTFHAPQHRTLFSCYSLRN
jgi:hypothetical protein